MALTRENPSLILPCLQSEPKSCFCAILHKTKLVFTASWKICLSSHKGPWCILFHVISSNMNGNRFCISKVQSGVEFHFCTRIPYHLIIKHPCESVTASCLATCQTNIFFYFFFQKVAQRTFYWKFCCKTWENFAFTQSRQLEPARQQIIDHNALRLELFLLDIFSISGDNLTFGWNKPSLGSWKRFEAISNTSQGCCSILLSCYPSKT